MNALQSQSSNTVNLRVYLSAAAIVIAVGALIPVFLPADIYGIVLIIFGVVFFMAFCRIDGKVANFIMVAYAIRIGFALFHHYIAPLPDSQSDALWFQNVAAQWSEAGVASIVQNFGSGAYLYAWLISIVFFLAGQGELLIQVINVIFGTLIVWNVFRITALVGSKSSAVKASWVATFFPTLILYSAVTMREAILVYLFTAGCIFLVKWVSNRKTTEIIKSIFLLFLAASLHTGLFAAVLVGLMFFGLYGISRSSGRYRVINIIVFLAVAGVFLIVVIKSGWGLNKLSRFDNGLSLDAVGVIQARAARGRASYLSGFTIHGFGDFVWQMPIRLIFFLLSPFPWMISSKSDLIGVLDAMLYWGLLILIMRKHRSLMKAIAQKHLIIMVFAVSIVFALPTSNYGTALRHRAKVVPLLIVLAFHEDRKQNPIRNSLFLLESSAPRYGEVFVSNNL